MLIKYYCDFPLKGVFPKSCIKSILTTSQDDKLHSEEDALDGGLMV